MSTSTWPPKEGLCTPTVSRAQGVFSLHHSVTIAAPASLVLSTLQNTAEYSEWNSWSPKATILSQPEGTSPESKELVLGTSFMLHPLMDLSKPTKDTPTQLRITDLSTPEAPDNSYVGDELLSDPSFTSNTSKVYRIAWKGEGSFMNRGLQSERFHEIIVLGDNECEVRTWEVMGGTLAYAVKWTYKKNLESKFVLWCDDLKKVCEEKAKAS